MSTTVYRDCVSLCMQICTIYVFSQETFVRGTIYNKVFIFMVLKEWSKDAVKYSQQVLSNNTRKIAIGHTAKCLCKLVLSYSFISMSFLLI